MTLIYLCDPSVENLHPNGMLQDFRIIYTTVRWKSLVAPLYHRYAVMSSKTLKNTLTVGFSSSLVTDL